MTLTDNLTFAQTVRELSDIDISPYADDSSAINQTSPEFAHEQETDPTLRHLWVKAQTGSSEFSVIEGFLYRKVPVNIPSMHEYALVVHNSKFQSDLIHMAHSNPLSGHQGICKTEQRLAALFYFSKMRKKIKEFVRFCEKCQMTAPKRK